jgi:serine/threonine-protein kinase
VIGRLAVGGMAEILIGALAGAAGFTRAVVIKRVLPKHARRADFRKMFVDEARIVSGLRHANVVDVLELGEEQDALYLVMEYLAGESLDVVLRRLAHAGERMPPAIAAHVVAEACAGLHAAHELRDADGMPKHVVHRDVSPHNLLVSYDGGVKVIDFGIAKAIDRETKTETGTLKGKLGYMSPEQIDGAQVDRRTDVFALGIVFWEALTGRRLFSRPSQLEIVKAICFAPIPSPREWDPAVDPELDRIAMKALARDLGERYATAAEMRRDLIAALRALDPEAAAGEQLGQMISRHFGDRIEAKREMLRRIASGSEVSAVAGALEIDDLDDLAEPEHAPQRHSHRSSRRWIGLAALGSAIAIAAAIAVATGGASSERGAAVGSSAHAHDPDRHPEPDPGPATVASEDTPPTARATITVTVDTVPGGASILVDGAPRGTSPAVIALPRGEGTHEVEVELAGFLGARELIDAAVDQRLRIVLERERRTTKRPARVPSHQRPSIFRVD